MIRKGSYLVEAGVAVDEPENEAVGCKPGQSGVVFDCQGELEFASRCWSRWPEGGRVLRHRIKRDFRDSQRCKLAVAYEEGGLSHAEKIELLRLCGYDVSRKASTECVDKIFGKAYGEAKGACERSEGMRMARNKRKRQRRRRAA